MDENQFSLSGPSVPGVKPSLRAAWEAAAVTACCEERSGSTHSQAVSLSDEMIHLMMHQEEGRQFQFNCDWGPC